MQLFSIAFYQCNHKRLIQNLPCCSQLTNYENPSIHNIFLKIITILILYHSYIFNLKFLDPLNTIHYIWQYLRNKSSYEVTVLQVHHQSSNTPNSNLLPRNNANNTANLNIDGELTDHRIDCSALVTQILILMIYQRINRYLIITLRMSSTTFQL